MPRGNLMKQTILVLGGGVVGGLLGYFAFFWVARQGFYGLVLPGGLLGLGAGLARNRSVAVAILCGILAIALGLFTEWRFAPFERDDSLDYFLLHVYRRSPVTLIMIVLGGAIGFWIPYRRIRANDR